MTFVTACYGPSISAGTDAGPSTSSATGTGGASAGTGGTGGASAGTGGTGGTGGASTGTGGTGGTSAGTGGTGGDAGTPVCADPNAGVGWAGDWGTILSHACTHSLGLGDPFVFDLSGVGHDCQEITADVWVPGISDVDGDPAGIRAEVLTTLGGTGQPPQLAPQKLTFMGRVGNNYRYAWNPYLPVVPVGSYVFSFRFSAGAANEGCWYRIGLDGGPGGGADRSASVVN